MLVLGKKRWLGLLFVLRGSPLQRIWLRLVVVVAVAVAVTVLNHYEGFFEVGLTVAPFSLIGLALGIFLGFRNNTSYDRFWEGRRLWGALVNTSRSITRQIHTLVNGRDPGDDVGDVRRELTHRVIAYVHSLRHHLRNEPAPGDARAFLDGSEADALSGESNPPIAVLHQIGERCRDEWKRGRVDAMHLPVLEGSLTTMTDIQGACERIKATPIPASYTLLIHRLVATYVFALPFGLVGTIHNWTPVVVALVAYAFLGLDAIGDEIEEPFGTHVNDLPLSTLSRMIEVNLRERLGDAELPPMLTPKDGILS